MNGDIGIYMGDKDHLANKIGWTQLAGGLPYYELSTKPKAEVLERLWVASGGYWCGCFDIDAVQIEDGKTVIYLGKWHNVEPDEYRREPFHGFTYVTDEYMIRDAGVKLSPTGTEKGGELDGAKTV